MDCLKRGEHGSRVRELQQLLRRPGYAVDIDAIVTIHTNTIRIASNSTIGTLGTLGTLGT